MEQYKPYPVRCNNPCVEHRSRNSNPAVFAFDLRPSRWKTASASRMMYRIDESQPFLLASLIHAVQSSCSFRRIIPWVLLAVSLPGYYGQSCLDTGDPTPSAPDSRSPAHSTEVNRVSESATRRFGAHRPSYSPLHDRPASHCGIFTETVIFHDTEGLQGGYCIDILHLTTIRKLGRQSRTRRRHRRQADGTAGCP